MPIASSIGLIPFLSSRAIIPVFASALLARFAPSLVPFASQAGIEYIQGLPPWMTSNTALVILGMGALCEMAANKSRTVRELGVFTDPWVKSAVAFLLAVHLVRGDLIDLLNRVQQQGLSEHLSQDALHYLWSCGIAGGVWFTASMRSANLMSLQELDPDDNLKVQGALSWFEDFFSFGGIFLVVIAPVLAMLAAFAAMVGLFLFKKALIRRERRKMVPCSQCSEPRHLCATRCHACDHAHESVHQVGFMGMIRKTPATDLAQHQFDMTAAKRCFACGDRYGDNQLVQTCQKCGRPPFRDEQEAQIYLRRVSQRLGKTLLVCAGFGLIPIVGLIPGISYYRVNLIAAMRAYLPQTSGCLTRWAARLAILVLIAFQGLGAGVVTVPLMCLIQFGIHHAVFQRNSATAFAKHRLKPA